MPFLDIVFDYDDDDFVESIERAHNEIVRRYTRKDYAAPKPKGIFKESFDTSSSDSFSIDRVEFEKALSAKWKLLRRFKSIKSFDKDKWRPAYDYPGLPLYHPPSKDAAFCILLNCPRGPKKPKFPKCSTNTALANYVHQLYIYESYLFNKMQRGSY